MLMNSPVECTVHKQFAIINLYTRKMGCRRSVIAAEYNRTADEK